MEQEMSPLAKGILEGLHEVWQDVQGIAVDGMKKTTIYNSVAPVNKQNNLYVRTRSMDKVKEHYGV